MNSSRYIVVYFGRNNHHIHSHFCNHLTIHQYDLNQFLLQLYPHIQKMNHAYLDVYSYIYPNEDHVWVEQNIHFL